MGQFGSLNRAFGAQLLDRLLSQGVIEFLHGEQRYSSPDNADQYNAILRDVEQCVGRGLEGEPNLSAADAKMLLQQAAKNSIVCPDGNIHRFVSEHDVDLYEHADFGKTLRQLRNEGADPQGVAKIRREDLKARGDALHTRFDRR